MPSLVWSVPREAEPGRRSLTANGTSGIEFDDVWVRAGERLLLQDLTLRLRQPRIGVIGANGSGKSTLARLINGLVAPSQGSVTVNGMDVAAHASQVRRQVGFLFSDADHQIVMPTVREDLEFSLRPQRLPKPERAARVEVALTDFGLLDHADHPCHLLSGGQKQLLALAAVLLSEPQIVVADEPTTLLDLRNQRMILERLDALTQQVILVTHHLELLRTFDRVIVIDEGRVVADDEPGRAVEWYVQRLV